MVRSGSANGTKHLSSDLLWSTPDSVVHAVWLYSLLECILTSKRRRRSCPRRHLPADVLRFALVSIKNLKTHQFYYQIFWGPGPLTSLPMVRPPHGVHHPTRDSTPLPPGSRVVSKKGGGSSPEPLHSNRNHCTPFTLDSREYPVCHPPTLVFLKA